MFGLVEESTVACNHIAINATIINIHLEVSATKGIDKIAFQGRRKQHKWYKSSPGVLPAGVDDHGPPFYSVCITSFDVAFSVHLVRPSKRFTLCLSPLLLPLIFPVVS